MERSIDRLELAGGESIFGITLSGETPFAIIWEEERSIYLFDDPVSEEEFSAQLKQHQV